MNRSDYKSKTLIGIYIDSFSDTEKLFKTIHYIIVNTKVEYEIILLLDRVKSELKREIQNLLTYQIISEFNLYGRTALFNKLIEKEASYYCFLESGIFISPQGIDQMLAQMESNKDIGIIGPSTNNSWNQQSLYKDENPEAVNVLHRFNESNKYTNSQELENLVETFFIVTKETIDKVGYADEKYANGYCWEIDYCIRIKKLGFRVVWSKSIYAHKSFINSETNRNKTSYHNVNYLKDKFCCKDEFKKTKDYCERCKGFSCEEFACEKNAELKITTLRQQLPLISCIMPTKNRSKFIPQSIKYFQEQDYPNLELIIVYDADSDLPEGLTHDDNIHLHKASYDNSIGSKRNLACQKANGEIIVHWDDDDWYSADRVSLQVKPIIANECDITGLNNSLFYLLANREFWECSSELTQKMLMKNVYGGTLAYSKMFWDNSDGYPNTSLREDADFMLKMIQNGASLKKIDGKELFIYLRHDNNTWVFKTGSFMEPKHWKKVDAPKCIVKDLDFYQSLKMKEEEGAFLQDKINTPKVTCIMPTADRREFVKLAIKYFQNQEYTNKELIIVDDGKDGIMDLIPETDKQIKYISLKEKTSIGAKRNIACKEADGKIIIHWDDDDWMSPNWIQYQVDSLIGKNADVTGLDHPYFFQPTIDTAWRYIYPETQKPWVHGGTLCYTKKLWERNPFIEINIGEDAHFLWSNCPKKIVPHNGEDLYVGIIHDNNVSPKYTEDKRWQMISSEVIKQNMGGDYGRN